MNLLEKINFKGEWFLPEDPENRLVGELVYTDSLISLYVHGQFSLAGIVGIEKPHKIVFGVIEGSKQVTLCDVFIVNVGSLTLTRYTEPYMPDSEYRVNSFMIGGYYADGMSYPFCEMRLHLTNFDEWVGITGWGMPEFNYEDRSFALEYKLPQPIVFDIPYAQLSGSINFTAKTPSIPIPLTGLCLRQQVYINLKSEDKKDLEEWFKTINIIQSFFVLAFGRSTNIDQLELYDENAKKLVQLYYVQSSIYYAKSFSCYDMLFTYRDVRDGFSTYINRWFELYDKLDDLTWLLVDQFFHNPRSSSNDFLNLAQLAEFLHAALYNHPYEDEQVHAQKVEEIVACVPNQYKDYVRNKIGANNMTLMGRLRELVDKCPLDLLGEFVQDREKFQNSVRDTRNYFTHYGTGNKKYVVSGNELYVLSKQLRILIMSIIYIELGFPQEILMNLKKMKQLM